MMNIILVSVIAVLVRVLYTTKKELKAVRDDRDYWRKNSKYWQGKIDYWHECADFWRKKCSVEESVANEIDTLDNARILYHNIAMKDDFLRQFNMYKLAKVCEILDVNIYTVDVTDKECLEDISDKIDEYVAYEKEHSDYYGMFPYEDLFFDVSVDINTALEMI